MIHHQQASPCRSRLLLPLLLFAAGLLGARPATAQTTITADAGLDHYYKSERWLPLQVRLTNQGLPARVEVRARFSMGNEGVDEYLLPERPLPGSANETHTLYIKAPSSYVAQPLKVELMKDGRSINPVKPQLLLVNDGDWLVLGIGASDSTLKLLTPVALPTSQAAPGSRPWMRGGQPCRVNVGIQEPAKTPDRWQGLEAADMVVLGDVSERDFTPEQQGALRDYVNAGGTLVVTGGVNWNRLTTPFFSEMLPVRVTGSRTVSSLPKVQALGGKASLSGSAIALCTADLKPGADAEVSEGGAPVIASGTRGAGRVVFLAFNPSLPPFRNWDGVAGFWKRLLTKGRRTPILSAIAMSDHGDEYNQYAYSGMPNQGQGRLADAPFAISQLDIPAFYIVALFLLAYIIVLVPVNYFFLKARDKKEYAWLTTPAIVAVFSFGAYMIGYGFKGGRTLVVKVGVIETHSGQDAAPNLMYAGLFSPRKTAYDIQLATNDAAGQAEAASTLLSEPSGSRSTAGLKVLQDDTQKVSGFAVDMWAMRVLKGEGMTRLGKGIAVRMKDRNGVITGTVRNNSPFTLDGCRLVTARGVVPLNELSPGKQVQFTSQNAKPGGTGTLLPATLMGEILGNSQESRMKRAVLQPLCTTGGTLPNGTGIPSVPLLAGWVREPVNRLQVDGRPPREQTATLMLVHVD
jgi:hypothetical protein